MSIRRRPVCRRRRRRSGVFAAVIVTILLFSAICGNSDPFQLASYLTRPGGVWRKEGVTYAVIAFVPNKDRRNKYQTLHAEAATVLLHSMHDMESKDTPPPPKNKAVLTFRTFLVRAACVCTGSSPPSAEAEEGLRRRR